MKKTPVEALRARLVALAAEDKALERQPFGRPDVVAAIASRAAYLAGEWRGRVDLALARLAAGQSAAEAVGLLLHPEKSGAVDAVAVLGLVGVDAIVNALQARLSDIVPEGPDSEARAARRAEIAAEREQVAREEERLIRASERAGTPILRRPDAPPWVVLAVDGDTVADDAPEPTPADVLEAQQQEALRAAGATAAAERLANMCKSAQPAYKTRPPRD
jgi:hypothetical protein